MRGLLSRGPAAALVLVLAAGCAHRAPTRREARLELPAGAFHLTYLDSDEAEAERVQRALRHALPRLARWGTLREPIHIQVLPSHEALEQATGRLGQGALRAWARYDEVLLQAPRTWGPFGASQAELEELLTHELTHCLMYQLAAERLTWQHKGIAPWFREGLASYTAGQQARWPDREDLLRKLSERPEWELLGPSERAYGERPQWAYAGAHHAFAFLIQRHGEAPVRELLGHMRRGASFAQAFEHVLGLTPQAFLQLFTAASATASARAAPGARPGS